MIDTIFLPYSGHANEVPVLQFATMLSAKLKAKIDIAYVMSELQLATREEGEKVRQVYEAKGYSASQDFLDSIYKEKLQKNAASAKQVFESFIKSSPTKSSFTWGEIDMLYGHDQLFKKRSYLHDLTLASYNLSWSVYSELVDGLLFGTGRPVLLVDEANPVKEELVAVIGWKPSAQSVHAIEAALPILKIAKACHVVAVQESEEDEIVPSAEDVAAYLVAKGIAAESFTYPASSAKPQELLTEHYKKVDANLMVMGAYSHSRMKEFVLGGFTKHFLDSRECNVLMAH